MGSFGVDYDLNKHQAVNIDYKNVYTNALLSTSGWICDPDEGSGHYFYGDGHVVYAETDEGIKERIDYAKSNSIAGMSYFSLSSDFESFFKYIK